jgi:hypothetical protein
MTLVCPKCKTPNETGGAAPGTAITCTCGNVLAVPKSGGMGGGGVALIVVAVLAIPCVIGILAAIAIPNFIKFQKRSKTMEARSNVRQLCTEERAFKEQNGKFLAAGPQPAKVPRGEPPVAFPSDPDFEKLGFVAEKVRYQYQVVVSQDGESAQCIARGDLDGNGVTSEYVYDTATGETSIEREFE